LGLSRPTKRIDQYSDIKGGMNLERSLEVMKNVTFQFDGDLEAKIFGVEIEAQSIVEDYKWMISKIEEQQKENAELENRINKVLDQCAVSWINNILKGY
jgi:hypothetical protein